MVDRIDYSTTFIYHCGICKLFLEENMTEWEQKRVLRGKERRMELEAWEKMRIEKIRKLKEKWQSGRQTPCDKHTCTLGGSIKTKNQY